MLFISPLHDLFELICKFLMSENLRGGKRKKDRKEIAPSSKSVKPQLLL